MASKSQNTETRARTFATVVYPESAPAGWLDQLAELKVPVFVSPLHDKDVNPTGEPKKQHYHVVMYFEGKKSKSQVEELIATFSGVGVEVVNSLRGYVRYLCHLDNPEKYQYSIEDVITFGGADFNATIGLPTDKYKAIKEMMSWCMDNDIYAYCDLLEYSAEQHPDWFRVLCDNGTIVVKEWLKSRSWKQGKCNKSNFEEY